MFESIEEPSLRDRLRGLALAAGACRLSFDLYPSLFPLLGTVPDWIFEVVRMLLFAGAFGGFLGGAAVVALALRRGERLAPAALWLALLVLAAGLCAWTWAWIAFASRV